MRSHRRPRLRVLLSVALAVLGLAACGTKISHVAGAENDGVYLKGGQVEYQLQVSRSLNPFEVEDHQYLTGLPAGTAAPASDHFWYGVFLWAQNKTHTPQTTADSFDIVDTQGNKYYAVPLNPTVNQYAWTSQTLGREQIEPGPDTTAAAGPTGGGLVLFNLPTTVYANRPLTLEINVPGQSQPSTISLDL